MFRFPFADKPDKPPSGIVRVCEAEADRQWRQLIMIPSESICHPAASAVLAGALGHIYAEGLPRPPLCRDPRQAACDEARFQRLQTRLSDRRFYKGTVNANRVELLAHKAIAEAFALLPASPDADDIHVNVQPLSGAAANLAVYDALLEPGDRIMGLDLSHGGHLTHGSRFNFSGKTYRVQSYSIDETTRRLDYDRIRRQALEWKPRLLIGGASAYPWDFDWATLRAIADEVGAFLLADIAHLAGMVVAGVLENPLPHADVVTLTTHKTLCGPRGAVILTDRARLLAGKINRAVFPGMQGGPHMNSIAAIARLFELILADYEGFRQFERDIVTNTRFFAECLVTEGFALEYGGTNTHMLLIDLKKFPIDGEIPLDGETASRLLEIAGIVCNKNLIPGDADAGRASGLRLGLPWLTQRGVTREQLREIARITRSVLERARTFAVSSSRRGKRCRGRVPENLLDEASRKTLAVAEALPYPPRPKRRPRPQAQSRLGDRVALRIRGEQVRRALGELLTARLPTDGSVAQARLLRADGSEIDDVVAAELEPLGGQQRWLLLVHAPKADAVRRWIERLSDGCLLLDEADLQQKIAGPNVVEELDVGDLPKELVRKVQSCPGEILCDLSKPYFVGQRALYTGAGLPAKEKHDEYTVVDMPARRTLLDRLHHDLGARMAPFAGWEMPIHYPAGIIAEHRAVRTAAGLFDISHMGMLEVSGPHAAAFLETLLVSCVSRLGPGEAQYSSLLYPDGTAVDDVFLYRLEKERFLLVVNAANAERVKDWVAAVASRRCCIDEEMPAKAVDGPVGLRDLREAGEDSLVGIALQGPASARILEAVLDDSRDRPTLMRLRARRIVPLDLAGHRTLVARTGYTGERVGFEVYVHPEHVLELWNALIDKGAPLGLLPAGLGARDAARTEAGLPLFDHELEGALGISLTEAGYGSVVKFHVPFFIGRRAYMDRGRRCGRHIVRLSGQGRRTVRPGHVILDAAGRPVGQVTSFAYTHEDRTFFAMACLEEEFQPVPGQAIKGARVSRERLGGEVDARSLVDLTVLTRFPRPDERSGWPDRYS